MPSLSSCSLWDGSPTTGRHHPSNIATAPLKRLLSEERRRHRHRAEWVVGCPWKEHGAHRLDAYEGLGSLALLIRCIAHVKHIITRKLSKDMIESSTAIGMDFAKPRSP